MGVSVPDPVAAERGVQGVVVIGLRTDRMPELYLPMKSRLVVDVVNAK
jgi:hypothetical protein